MKLILSIYDHGVILHVKFSEDVISCRGVIAIFFTLISLNLSIQSHSLVTNRWNFMKLMVSIYSHGLIMHSKVVRMSLVIEDL